MFEWLRENDFLWRRGSKVYKNTDKKNAAWDAKGAEMNHTSKHLLGWWKNIHTWYVKLHKMKSGEGTKRYSDRELEILRQCAFYGEEVQHRKHNPEPMKSLSSASTAEPARSDVSRDVSRSRDGSPTPGTPAVDSLLTASGESSSVLERMEANHETPSTSQDRQRNRGTKRSREEVKDSEVLCTISESLKTNNQLLLQLVDTRPKSNRDAFITYLGDTLRRMEDKDYRKFTTKINGMILGDEMNSSFSEDKDEPPVARPPASRSAPAGPSPQGSFYGFTSQQPPATPNFQWNSTQQFDHQHQQYDQLPQQQFSQQQQQQFSQQQQQYQNQPYYQQPVQQQQPQQQRQSKSPQQQQSKKATSTATARDSAGETADQLRAAAEVRNLLNTNTT